MQRLFWDLVSAVHWMRCHGGIAVMFPDRVIVWLGGEFADEAYAQSVVNYREMPGEMASYDEIATLVRHLWN